MKFIKSNWVPMPYGTSKARLIIPAILAKLVVKYGKDDIYPKWLMFAVKALGGHIEYKENDHKS
jgi:hypothetical protein